jgi:hypothetical protein
MKCQRYITRVPALIATLFVMLFRMAPAAYAVDRVSVDNLQAAMRTLSFLESLPKQGKILVGVVYLSDVPTGQTLAEETAKAIVTMQGPNARILQTVIVSANDLAKFDGRLDVLFLVTGASKQSELILSAMSRNRLVSISDDPACVDAKCCVLMVRAGQRVEIFLNTALAESVGARFSLVFMMVVKRK